MNRVRRRTLFLFALMLALPLLLQGQTPIVLTDSAGRDTVKFILGKPTFSLRVDTVKIPGPTVTDTLYCNEIVTVCSKTKPTPPSPVSFVVTGLKMVMQNKQILISWDAVPTATKYKLSHASDSLGTYTAVAWPITTSTLRTPTTTGRHCYRIRVEDVSGVFKPGPLTAPVCIIVPATVGTVDDSVRGLVWERDSIIVPFGTAVQLCQFALMADGSYRLAYNKTPGPNTAAANLPLYASRCDPVGKAKFGVKYKIGGSI